MYVIGLIKGALKNLGACLDEPLNIKMLVGQYQNKPILPNEAYFEI